MTAPATLPARMERRTCRLVLDNDVNAVPAVAGAIYGALGLSPGEGSLLVLGLQEILINAVEHGNLGINFAEKTALLESGRYLETLAERAKNPAVGARRVTVEGTWIPGEVTIQVTDEGEGFDWTVVPDLDKVDALDRESGRGIALAVQAFDEVRYSPPGNRVTLRKRLPDLPADLSGRILQALPAKDSAEARSLALELNLAAEFQRTFLPSREKLASFEGVGVAYRFFPKQLVSGDFIDISRLEGGIYGLFISDIAGHGVAAALISAILKVFFSLYARDVLSPQLLFEILNTEFYDYLNSGEYFTSFYGIYFQEERRFIYTNANHPPPLLLRAGEDEPIPLESEGFFVGVFPDAEFEEREYRLEPGDRLLLYTDGVIEARDAGGRLFGLPRLVDSFRAGRDEAVEEGCRRIEADLKHFTGGRFDDDVTFALIEV